MRITYRNKSTKEYWKNRWDKIAVDDEMFSENDYPLKYALKTIVNKDNSLSILEAGCGNGRILRYFHNRQYDIHGFDYIETAINKLKKIDSTLSLSVNDIMNTGLQDNFYDVILAFGLFHNFEYKDLKLALKETNRILKKNGKICLSFRSNNIQNYLNDFFKNTKKNKKFHKLNLNEFEFKSLLHDNKFQIEEFYYVQNMPFFYKFKIFRDKDNKEFDENIARKYGYKLNLIGFFLQKNLMKFLGPMFCNVYVAICKKY